MKGLQTSYVLLENRLYLYMVLPRIHDDFFKWAGAPMPMLSVFQHSAPAINNPLLCTD